MAVEQVHQAVIGRVGVVLADRGDAIRELGGADDPPGVGESLRVEAARRKQAEHRVTQAIVHRRVEPVAAQHAQQRRVLLPRLADRQRRRICGLHDVAERLPVAIRERGVAAHIQAPAAGTGIEPARGDRVIGREEVGLHVGVRLVQDGDRIEAEPAGIGHRVRAARAGAGTPHLRGEGEPGAVRRVGRFARADGRVMPVAIEERRVAAQVVEDAVDDDPDPARGRVLDEIVPVLLRPEGRIDLRVVLRVVAVVAAGVEDRVEVDGGDAQADQRIQLLVDALEVATQVIAAARLLLRR